MVKKWHDAEVWMQVNGVTVSSWLSINMIKRGSTLFSIVYTAGKSEMKNLKL